MSHKPALTALMRPIRPKPRAGGVSSLINDLKGVIMNTTESNSKRARVVCMFRNCEALARWHFTTLKSSGRPEVLELWLCDQHLTQSKAEDKARGVAYQARERSGWAADEAREVSEARLLYEEARVYEDGGLFYTARDTAGRAYQAGGECLREIVEMLGRLNSTIRGLELEEFGGVAV